MNIPMRVAVQGAIPVSVATVSGLALEIGAQFKIGGQPYHGEYEFTPSAETQTISVQDRFCLQDITINPIPNNYGLITYNGSSIMVS